jgi:hypothetical protein
MYSAKAAKLASIVLVPYYYSPGTRSLVLLVLVLRTGVIDAIVLLVVVVHSSRDAARWRRTEGAQKVQVVIAAAAECFLSAESASSLLRALASYRLFETHELSFYFQVLSSSDCSNFLNFYICFPALLEHSHAR